MIRSAMVFCCLVAAFAACAGAPGRPVPPASAPPKPVPPVEAAPPAPVVVAPPPEPAPPKRLEPPPAPVRPARLKLPPAFAAGASAADLVAALDRRTARIEALYGFMAEGPTAAESAWLNQAARTEADQIYRILERVTALKPQASAVRPEKVCAGRYPRLFPKFGYQGPEDKRKIPFLKDAEALTLASLGDMTVIYLCEHTPENGKRVAAAQAQFDAVRLEWDALLDKEPVKAR